MKRQVKICGISTIDALDTAIANRSDFIGLVFYPPSPRNIDITSARNLADRARGRSKIVALTVDASDDLLGEITAEVRPDYFQLHGSETPERVMAVKTTTRLPVIKAIKVRNQEDVYKAEAYQNAADIILFDAKVPDNSPEALPGGNGVRFDWLLLNDTNTPEGYMLSGGLDIGNIATALKTTNAAIFDVSTGVEFSPGKKDLAAIKNFIVAMRNAS